MFATLVGPLPTDAQSQADPADRLREAVDAQASAGLEPIADGLEPVADGTPGEVVARWRATAAIASGAVKQALVGPFTAGIGAGATGPAGAGFDGPNDAAAVRRIDAAAERLRDVVAALAEAGCPLVEIHEPAIVPHAADPDAGARFLAAQRRLVDGLDGIHLSLVVSGGNVDAAGPATFFDAGYASYAFDLIAGPDNWRLIAAAPADRGIVCGALDPSPAADDRPELLVWAAHYAASTRGRGLVRVGLANASSLAALTPERARPKLAALAEAARIAGAASTAELAAELDPRAIDSRTAAYGRVVPRPPRRARRPGTSRPGSRRLGDGGGDPAPG